MISTLDQLLLLQNYTDFPVYQIAGHSSLIATASKINIPSEQLPFQPVNPIDARFMSGLIQSFILIFLSEIGDRSFILIMIYSTKLNFWALLLVSSIVLCIVHTITTLLGKSIAYFIPQLATEIIAICLFWLIGIYAIFTSCRVYRKKYLRRKAGLPETTEESEEEII